MSLWTSELSTGIPLLDEHHQEIFLWLAELESATADKRTLFGVYALTRLKHHVSAHFAAEEALMQAMAYPQLSEHRQQHAEFRGRLGELQANSIGQDIPLETVDFLNNWFLEHITQTDMCYVPYLKNEAIQP